MVLLDKVRCCGTIASVSASPASSEDQGEGFTKKTAGPRYRIVDKAALTRAWISTGCTRRGGEGMETVHIAVQELSDDGVAPGGKGPSGKRGRGASIIIRLGEGGCL